METKHKTFKPYDRVLVRHHNDSIWNIDFYSHYDNVNRKHETYGAVIENEDRILAFEGNEHLLGTTDEPEEEITYGDEFVFGLSRDQHNIPILEGFMICGKVKGITRIDNKEYFDLGKTLREHIIRHRDFNPSDMEESRKHILCVKDGKIVRYKE